MKPVARRAVSHVPATQAGTPPQSCAAPDALLPTLFRHHGSDLPSALISWGPVPSTSHTYTSSDSPPTPANQSLPSRLPELQAYTFTSLKLVSKPTQYLLLSELAALSHEGSELYNHTALCLPATQPYGFQAFKPADSVLLPSPL